MTPFMLTVSRSQWAHSSFPAELWFSATETKPHSSAQIKRCCFTATANERLLKPNWRRVRSQEFKRLTEGGRQWARQLLPAQSCQLTRLIWAWCYRCASNSYIHPVGKTNAKQLNIGTLVADITSLRPFRPSANLLLLSLLSLFASSSLTFTAGWIRSSTGDRCVLLNERGIHHHLGSPPNQRGSSSSRPPAFCFQCIHAQSKHTGAYRWWRQCIQWWPGSRLILRYRFWSWKTWFQSNDCY